MKGNNVKPKLTFGKELRFSPYAWGKLIWFRDRGPTEVAGYCITSTEDPLLVTDFVLIKQECTMVSFDLDTDDGVEYVERMMDKGLPPWSTNNILAHTHPSVDTTPSPTDETNFRKAFSHPDWAIMLIVGTDGSTYCRLKMNTGPGTIILLDVVIDYSVEFGGSNIVEWEKEYKEKVFREEFHMTGSEGKRTSLVPNTSILDVFENELGATSSGNSSQWWNDDEAVWLDLTPEQIQKKEFEAMLDEMDCYWDVDGDAVCWDIYEGEECAYYYNPDTKQWQVDVGTEDGFSVCQPPIKGGLGNHIVAWAKRNEYCRPEKGEVMV